MVLCAGCFGANRGGRGKIVKPQMAAVLSWPIQMDADASPCSAVGVSKRLSDTDLSEHVLALRRTVLAEDEAQFFVIGHGLIGLLPLESLEPPESASAAPPPPAITKPPSRTGGEINVDDCPVALGVLGVPASTVGWA
jgi:hypothetical protein